MKAGAVKSTAIKSTPIKPKPGKSKTTKAPATKVSSTQEITSKEKSSPIQGETYLLRLYVAGKSPKCLTAFVNLKKICEEHLAGKYRLEVIDLLENPTLAGGDQILAIPTLVRRLPEPMRKIIGDLSNTERVLIGLDVRPREADQHD